MVWWCLRKNQEETQGSSCCRSVAASSGLSCCQSPSERLNGSSCGRRRRLHCSTPTRPATLHCRPCVGFRTNLPCGHLALHACCFNAQLCNLTAFADVHRASTETTMRAGSVEANAPAFARLASPSDDDLCERRASYNRRIVDGRSE